MFFNRTLHAFDLLYRVFMRVSGWTQSERDARTQFGCRMLCDTKDFIQRRIYYFGVYEHNLTHYINSIVRSGNHVVDVGANVGYVSLLFSKLVGTEGQVTAIEASPTTFVRLKNNLAINDAANVVALNVAATRKPCRIRMVVNDRKNIGSAQIVESNGSPETEIAGDSISNILSSEKAFVSLIKIDIEGSEGPVLQDIAENLEHYPNLKQIVVELREENAEFIHIFAKLGFKSFGMPNNYSISYYLVRRWLTGVGEGQFVTKVPLSEFNSSFTDYVFER